MVFIYICALNNLMFSGFVQNLLVIIFSIPLSARKFASTVVLTVKTVLLRELAGALVAVFLFEVGKEIIHSVRLRKLRADLIEPSAVFVRTYR